MLVWILIIGVVISAFSTALIFLFWMVKDLKSSINKYCVSLDAYHDCNDYIICDEGHPEKPFKCTECGKRY